MIDQSTVNPTPPPNSRQDVDQNPAEDFDAGHSPETGILTRLRDWTDVAPPLMLARTMRLAGSPILVGIGWLLCCLTSSLATRFSGTTKSVDVFAIAAFIGLLVVWIVGFAILFRQGALLTAGRDMESLGKIAKRIGSRWLSILVVVLAVPLASAAASLLIAPPLWIASLLSPLGIGGLVQLGMAILVAVMVIPAALLLAASVIAIPIAISAIVNEPDPDPLDSLSRGYEYAMRGWLPAIGFVTAAAFFVVAIFPAAYAISQSACWLVATWSKWIGPSFASQLTIEILGQLPVVMMLTIAGGCVGGVYLLLRRATGGQEVEDIWTDDRPPAVPLPELQN